MFFLFFILVFAALFHRAAEIENESGLLWAGLSALVSLATFYFLQWGWIGTLAGQAALFIGIGLFRAFRQP